MIGSQTNFHALPGENLEVDDFSLDALFGVFVVLKLRNRRSIFARGGRIGVCTGYSIRIIRTAALFRIMFPHVCHSVGQALNIYRVVSGQVDQPNTVHMQSPGSQREKRQFHRVARARKKRSVQHVSLTQETINDQTYPTPISVVRLISCVSKNIAFFCLA